MPKLTALSGKEIIRLLNKFGYYKVRQCGSHIRLSCEGKKSITVPNYREISKGLIQKILRDAEISKEEFKKFIK